MENKIKHSISAKRVFTLVILFALAFSVRFAFVSRSTFNHESLDLIVSAQKTSVSGILHYARGVDSPLAVLCTGFFIDLFKSFGIADPSLGANFMSVFFGSVSIILFFLCVEKLLDTKKAFISALLLSFFGPHIEVSTFANSLILSMCGYLASLLCMLIFKNNNRKSFLYFSAVFLGLSAAARFADLVMILPLAYLFFYSKASFSRRPLLFCRFLLVVLLTAGLYYFLLFYEKGISVITPLLSRMKFLSSQNSAWMGLLDIFMPEGLILVSVGLSYMLLKNNIRLCIFIIIWFLVFQFSYSAFGASRFLVAACVPLIIAQGSFIGGFRSRMFYVSALLACIIGLGGFLRFYDLLELKRRYPLEIGTASEYVMEMESVR
jgi:hypothetical protein